VTNKFFVIKKEKRKLKMRGSLFLSKLLLTLSLSLSTDNVLKYFLFKNILNIIYFFKKLFLI